MKLLVLGGGGTLGAFSAGALEVLRDSGWTPDAFIGSSAGSINLLRYLEAGPEAAIAFWREMGLKTLVTHAFRHNAWREGILDPRAFHARVDRGIDYGRMLHDPRILGFIVCDLETGLVSVRGNHTERTSEALRAVAHGSYSLPPLLRPVPLDGQLLSDGGLLHNAPLNVARDLGATEIVYLCNVRVLPHQGFARACALRSTLRYGEIFFRRASNVGFADAEIVDRRFRGIPILVIAPPSSLRFGAMARWMLPTVDAMDHLIQQGHISARHALEQSHFIERMDHLHALS